ncbi:hypothetical protein ACTFIR_003927 [Dictyostelium discoideum]
MSTTVNNNDVSNSSTSASNNPESFDLRMKSMEDQINNLSLAFTRFMKEPMFSSNTNSCSQRSHDDSDTESEQNEVESSNNFDVPTDYQLSDTLLGQYKHMVNNQCLLVEEECILKKDEISEFSNSISSSGSNGRSNNFNGSPSNVASGSNNTKSTNEEQEVKLPVGGRLFQHKQVWKELGLPNFCQEVVNGLNIHLLPNFKPMPNPIPFSIPEGPKSNCITNIFEVEFDQVCRLPKMVDIVPCHKIIIVESCPINRTLKLLLLISSMLNFAFQVCKILHFKDIYNSTSTLKLNWFFNLTEKFRKNGMLDNEDKIKITNFSFINDLIGQFSKNRDILDPNFEIEMEKIANYFISYLNSTTNSQSSNCKTLSNTSENTSNNISGSIPSPISSNKGILQKSSKVFVDNESENDNDNSSYSDSDSDSEINEATDETKDILKYLFTSIENINDKLKGIEELISTSKTSTSTSKTSTSNNQIL